VQPSPPWIALSAALLLAAVPARSAAQAVGSEFQINTYTTGNQGTPGSGSRLIAANAGGSFLVVWASDATWDIFGQRFDDAGNAVGSEFRVNSYTTFPVFQPSIASDASGNFVVVWDSDDGFQNGVFGQRLDSEGGSLGNEFRVNSYTTGPQSWPSVASDAIGNFVVVWQGPGQGDSSVGVFGQRFDSAGVAQGSEFRVNSYTTSNQITPSVASDASGNVVVAWVSVGQDGSNWGVFGQRYDSGGNTLGGEFRVNSYTMGYQGFP
jgi:hypothetical protein